MPYGAAYEAAQHVAPAFVARHHAVRNQECGAAAVFGDGGERVIGIAVSAPALGGYLFGALHHRAKDVGFVDGGDILHNHGGALKPQACVDAGRGQRRAMSVQVVVELHEHEVPKLHIAVANLAVGVHYVFAVGAAVGLQAASAFAEIVVEFAAWSAWAFVAGRAPPVVGVAELVDAACGDAYILPKPKRLFVRIVDGDGEALARQP